MGWVIFGAVLGGFAIALLLGRLLRRLAHRIRRAVGDAEARATYTCSCGKCCTCGQCPGCLSYMTYCRHLAVFLSLLHRLTWATVGGVASKVVEAHVFMLAAGRLRTMLARLPGDAVAPERLQGVLGAINVLELDARAKLSTVDARTLKALGVDVVGVVGEPPMTAASVDQARVH